MLKPDILTDAVTALESGENPDDVRFDIGARMITSGVYQPLRDQVEEHNAGKETPLVFGQLFAKMERYLLRGAQDIATVRKLVAGVDPELFDNFPEWYSLVQAIKNLEAKKSSTQKSLDWWTNTFILTAMGSLFSTADYIPEGIDWLLGFVAALAAVRLGFLIRELRRVSAELEGADRPALGIDLPAGVARAKQWLNNFPAAPGERENTLEYLEVLPEVEALLSTVSYWANKVTNRNEQTHEASLARVKRESVTA